MSGVRDLPTSPLVPPRFSRWKTETSKRWNECRSRARKLWSLEMMTGRDLKGEGGTPGETGSFQNSKRGFRFPWVFKGRGVVYQLGFPWLRDSFFWEDFGKVFFFLSGKFGERDLRKTFRNRIIGAMTMDFWCLEWESWLSQPTPPPP